MDEADPTSAYSAFNTEFETFEEELRAGLDESFLDFPGYQQLSKSPESSMKWIAMFQQKLTLVSQWATTASFKRIKAWSFLSLLRKQEAQWTVVKPMIRAMEDWKNKLYELEQIAKHREKAMENEINSLKSIQNAGTSRRMFGEGAQF